MVVEEEVRVVARYSSLGAVVVVDSRNRLRRLHSLHRTLLEAHWLRRIEYNDYRPQILPPLEDLIYHGVLKNTDGYFIMLILNLIFIAKFLRVLRDSVVTL